MSSDQAISSSNNNNNSNANVGTNSGVFQGVRPPGEPLATSFESQMAMLQMKQQPMASSFTGAVYSGPPAKYLNNTANNYLRPMMSTQKYMSYSSGPAAPMQARRPNTASVENATNDKRKVFVGGLSSDTKMEHLRDYFSTFGNVESATVKCDKSGRSKGFGFVLFEDPSTPELVFAQEVHVIQGKRVDTKSAHRRDQALVRKVFVGGLDPEVTDNELKEYFSQFGKITQIEAPIDKNKQKRRPFCFILFENEQSAEEVLKQPRHMLAGKSIDCKRANPKTLNNNQANNPMIPPALPHHFPMAGINQNPFQYTPQPRSQQQLPYPQVALAAQPQQHYSFYNATSLGQQTSQQGQNRSQSSRQQLANNNQAWSPISPAQWQNANYVDPRTFNSYGPGSATNANTNWQVNAAPSQANSYGQARNQSANSNNAPGTNSTSGHYSYPNWNFNQTQGPLPPNQYNYAAESTNGPANSFGYPPAAGYDQF